MGDYKVKLNSGEHKVKTKQGEYKIKLNLDIDNPLITIIERIHSVCVKYERTVIDRPPHDILEFIYADLRNVFDTSNLEDLQFTLKFEDYQTITISPIRLLDALALYTIKRQGE